MKKSKKSTDGGDSRPAKLRGRGIRKKYICGEVAEALRRGEAIENQFPNILLLRIVERKG